MDTGYITAVTLNEFIVWFSTGELRIHRRRLLSVQLKKSGMPDIDKFLSKQMMDFLPHVDLEDEHNILIITLSEDPILNNKRIGDESHLLAFDIAYVSAESILTIQPLTHRGSDIVKSRLHDLHLRLELPMFEKEINELWNEWSVRRSLRGADALLELTVREPIFKPSTTFIKQAEKAISLINEQQKASPNDSFIVNVMCYNRHDDVPEQDIGYLIDLGIILSQLEKTSPKIKPIVESLRQLCIILRQVKDNRKLTELLTDSGVQKVFHDFLDEYESEIGLGSAALFLKWKYLIQRKQRIEIKSMVKDVRDCSSRVAKLNVEKALWLLGFYCGFDRMALEYYMRTEYGRYRFVERRVTNEPVELSKDIVELTPQVKVSEEVSKSNKLDQVEPADLKTDGKLNNIETKIEDVNQKEASSEKLSGKYDKNIIDHVIKDCKSEQNIEKETQNNKMPIDNELEQIKKDKSHGSSKIENDSLSLKNDSNKKNLKYKEQLSNVEYQQEIDYENKNNKD